MRTPRHSPPSASVISLGPEAGDTTQQPPPPYVIRGGGGCVCLPCRAVGEKESIGGGCPAFCLILRPLPDASDPDGIRRLRGFLKSALRQWRLRCVRAERTTETCTPTGLQPDEVGTDARGSGDGEARSWVLPYALGVAQFPPPASAT